MFGMQRVQKPLEPSWNFVCLIDPWDVSGYSRSKSLFSIIWVPCCCFIHRLQGAGRRPGCFGQVGKFSINNIIFNFFLWEVCWEGDKVLWTCEGQLCSPRLWCCWVLLLMGGVGAALLLPYWHCPLFWCPIIELCAARRKHGDSFFRDHLSLVGCSLWITEWHFWGSITVIDSLAVPACSCRCWFLFNHFDQSSPVFLWDEETNCCVSFHLFSLIIRKNRYVLSRGVIHDIP